MITLTYVNRLVDLCEKDFSLDIVYLRTSPGLTIELVREFGSVPRRRDSAAYAPAQPMS